MRLLFTCTKKNAAKNFIILNWEKREVPQLWKEASMISIHKKGKDKSKSASYRPISLTSFVVKTIERIVNHRIMCFFETEKIIYYEEQSGFRQFISTEIQVTYLSQEMEDAFQEKKVLYATWIDLQKAFDKVWTDGLLVKAQRCGIGGKMYRWVSSFLHNRKARVTVDGKECRKFLLRHGVPQGGVISPPLFLIFIYDLVKELPNGIKHSSRVTWSCGVRRNMLLQQLSECSRRRVSWCHDPRNGMLASTKKNPLRLFSP